ncbi:MAG TPA: sigma 54-interacting transcriptional regulator, partial [Steroidobacteraceae bacterium]
PGCRLLLDPDYRIVATNSAYHACCGSHCACSTIGRYCYEVSHGYDAPCDSLGEPCPLEAARDSGHAERCVHVHHTAAGQEHVEIEITPLRDETGAITLYMERMDRIAAPGHADPFVGRDPSFLRTLESVKRVGPTNTSVLLLGETGTGKEVMARTVHELSDRADQPFVLVDCAGLAETLFESELFGHERGAFTGAAARKPGLVESASGGTLFIDEVGDIPLSLQVKLLRVVETGLFRRVGGTEMQRTDFRLVAATHRDLRQLVAAGTFRPDLYYRISTFPITVPPLRERPLDILLLAESMLRRLRGSAARLTPAARRALQGYSYPGNVRELRNVMERAALLADGDVIDVRHLPESFEPDGVAAVGAAEAQGHGGSPLVEAEREALRSALRNHRGSRRALAERLGLSERTLYRKLRDLEPV